MLAKIKVGNPEAKIDYYGNYELIFPVENDSKFAVKQLMKATTNNKKTLEIKLDFFKKHRSLDQNALMWALLSEYALFLNGGRRGSTTEEELYYKLLQKHGVCQVLLVIPEAVETLKQAYRGVTVIDKVVVNKQTHYQCKCILGSSNYSTNQMTDLIEGLLDDMEEAGVNTQNMRALEEDWRSYYANCKEIPR